MKRSCFAFITALFCLLIVLPSCSKDSAEDPAPADPAPDPLSNIENTYGYGLFNHINGIWNGPVTSTTPLGGYPEWIVDFRPISENQVSAKNELDSLNDIFMSFFVAKHNNQYRLAFRNGGSFAGNKRVSYFLCDSVSETASSSYYRFSEIIIGKNRAYTEVIFRSDSLYIHSYTNNYNSQMTSTPHMSWSAKKQDQNSCAAAIAAFNFPQKTLTKDFTNTFTGQNEAVYYGTNAVPAGDPYPETEHPNLGQTTLNYSYAAGFTPDNAKKVFIMISTQPLISGATINMANLATRSRYVILAADDLSYTFNYMHPGTYYAYALYDNDGSMGISSGDWVSTANTSFSLGSQGNTTSSVLINFVVP